MLELVFGFMQLILLGQIDPTIKYCRDKIVPLPVCKKKFVLKGYDAHHEVVINRAKFDACTSSSFEGLKTDRQTERRISRLVAE